MPAGDGTGPFGRGPMTGRGAGFCSGFNAPGYANFGMGRGWGRGGSHGRGGGRGWGGGRGRGMGRGAGWSRWFGFGGPQANPWGTAAQPSAAEERSFLEQQAGAIQAQLDQIKARLDELAKEGTDKA